MGGQTFYDTLGVPEGAPAAAVKRSVRERLSEYEQAITEADDPEMEARVYQLAYEVLTDPKERHLYDLYGHDRYVDERLDVDGTTLEHAALGADVTPVFTGVDGTGDTKVFDPSADEGDTGSTEGANESETRIFEGNDATSGEPVDADTGDSDTHIQEAPEEALASVTEEATLIEQLAAYGPWVSPLVEFPGMDTDPPLRYLTLAGYAVVALGGLALLGLLLPYGSAALAVLSVVTFLVGGVATVVAGAVAYERKTLLRSAGGAGACLPAVGLVGYVAAPPPATLFAGIAVGLAGVAAGDVYLSMTRQRHREVRKGDESRGGGAYLETDGGAGTEDDSIDGEALIDGVSRKETVPEDLEDEVVIRSTRMIVPERHIRRELTVQDSRSNRELPPGEFAAFRDSVREDVHDRDQHHPGGFEDMTTTYLMPSSVEEIACPDCRGTTRVTCSTCGGGGTETCPKCHGSGRNSCQNCDGSGNVRTRERCANCGGTGEVSGDRACPNCNGSGSVTSHHTCSTCAGRGSNPCDRCNATGNITCRKCNGSGEVPCGRCNATGSVVTLTTLTREYRADETVQYDTRSVPKRYLTEPPGNQIQCDRTMNGSPDAAAGDWFMREHEIREVPTAVATYEYAGDLYEAYEIEGEVQAPDAPQNLTTAARNAAIAGGLFFAAYLSLGILGPTGLP